MKLNNNWIQKIILLSKSKSILVVIKLLTLICVIILAWWYFKDKGSELSRIHNLHFIQLLWLSLSIIGIAILEGTRTQVIARAFDVYLRYPQAFRIAAVSTLGNYLPVLPVGVIAKGIYFKKLYKLSYSYYIGGLIFSVIITVLVFGIIGFFTSLVTLKNIDWVLILIFSTMIISMLSLLLLLNLIKSFLNKYLPKLEIVIKGIILSKKRHIYLALIAIDIASLYIITWRFMYLGQALGYSISFSQAVLISSIAMVVQIVSIFTPNGLGIREIVSGAIAHSIGFDFSIGLYISSVERVITFAWAVIIGVVAGRSLINNKFDNPLLSRKLKSRKLRIAMLLGHHPVEPMYDIRVWREYSSLSKKYKVKIFVLSPPNLRYRRDARICVTKLPINIKTRGISSYTLISRLFLSLIAFNKYIKQTRNYQPDIIHCHDVDTLIFGLLAQSKRGTSKLIYDSHEAASEMISWKKLKLFITVVERYALPRIAGLIAPSKAILGLLRKKYSILYHRNTLALYNYPEAKKEIKISRRSIKSLFFLYQGNFKTGRGLEQFIDAFVQYGKDQLILCGGTDKEIHNIKKRIPKGVNNIRFLGRINQEELLEQLGRADVGIVPIINDCLNSYYGTPNKLFEYLLAGCVIICPNFPTFKETVAQNNVGFICNFSSEKEILKSLKIINKQRVNIRSMQRRAKMIARRKYTWEMQEPELFKFYSRITH